MNIVNKLTLRQLKMNKKRTLVTMIGTIISAAMITVVATLGLSFMGVMQRQSIATNGEWHVKYNSITQSQLSGISSDRKVKSVVLSRDTGYAYLDGSKNLNKPYLYIKELSTEGFRKFPIVIMQGRLPNHENEIVVSQEVLTNAKVDYHIGDSVDLSLGQRYPTSEIEKENITAPMLQSYSLIWENNVIAEALTQGANKTYTIVGFMKRPLWEYNWSPGYCAIAYIGDDTITSSELFDVYIVYKKVDSKLFDHAKELALENGINDYEFNNDLLRYYGICQDDTVKQMLYTLTAIIMIIIMIGSVSLIYNAFAISVSERSRHLGMLASVGATKRQKRNSVFFEGAVIGVISIPIGILAGYLGLGITYLFINPMIEGMLDVSEGFQLTVYPSSLITTVLVSGATILISTYLPARRASNISAIDAIRQVADVKINRKMVRTSKITRRIFGIEGDLGLKNLKRNKGRYKATVFSLIISMMLFLVVSSFTGYLRKSWTMTQEGINFDILTSIDADTYSSKEEIANKISSLNYVDEMAKKDTLIARAWIKEDKIADYLKDDNTLAVEDGAYQYNITINVLDDKKLVEYAKEVGVDMKKLTDENQPAAIVIDTMKFKDNEEDKYVEAKTVKMELGELLELSVDPMDANESIALKPVKVVALTDQMPMGVMSLGKTNGFHIIMSENSFHKLMEGNEENITSYMDTNVYFNSDEPLKLQEELEKVQSEVGANNLYIYNVYNYKNNEQQALLLVNVFTYAFIILITAICIANIINTISTSISLRKREFAMLKSIGITPKSFNKMLNYESIFYGLKALIYGLPISIFVIYLMYLTLMKEFDFKFCLPYRSICIVVIAVFIIVGTAMLYSSSRVRKENIIDALKQEII